MCCQPLVYYADVLMAFHDMAFHDRARLRRNGITGNSQCEIQVPVRVDSYMYNY